MTTSTPRRDFVRTSTAASGILLLKPETVFGTQANSAIEIGLIGCGNRGHWIAGHFIEFTQARIVALADILPDKLDSARQKFKVDPSRVFRGFDSYKELVQLKLDAVVVESPDYFHPPHVAAAVKAGKHVYMPKPVAVDVPGCLSILESGKQAAARKQILLVDFQSRVRPVFEEAAARVHRGEIGKLVMGHVYYHSGRLMPRTRPGASEAENRMRNWYFDKVLSGDIIVDQDIHPIDMTNWYLQAHPIRAIGTGGRMARVDVGNCWDHFLVQFHYPGDVKVDFSGMQFSKGFHDICARIYGTTGTLDSHYAGAVNILGDNPWKGTEKDSTFDQGAIKNVKDFVASIQAGKLMNNVPVSVESTLTTILGRTAAYRQKMVTWDEMMRENEKLEANLDTKL